MDGIIIVNKPKGCTSHDIVYKIKKMTNTKVGHTGTLDPMATGVLPLLIGKGTLCSKYLINHDKIYQAKIQLGKKTDTADYEGRVVEEQPVSENNMKKENIRKTLNSFLGKQKQIPPIYSAIKVNGKKLYEYARKGQKVNIEPREIEIYDIELIQIDSERKQLEFKVKCSKGTYIRSLCEDIAKKLNTVGYMCELKRIQVGDFSIEKSVTMEELQNGTIDSYIIPLEKIFKNSPKIELDRKGLQLFLNGVKLTVNNQDGTYKIYSQGNFIGIGIINKKLLKRDIII